MVKEIKEINIAVKILLLIIIILGGYFILHSSLIYDVKEYKMYLNVSEKLGFDLSKDHVNFGLISPGGSATKDLYLYNNFSSPVVTRVKISGEISKFVELNPSTRFIISPNSNRTLSLTARVPETEKLGNNYDGKLTIQFTRF